MSKLLIDQYLKEAFKRNKSAQTHKDVHIRAEELIRRCWAEDVFIVFTDGLRTNEDQARLYGKGRKSSTNPKTTTFYNGKDYADPSAKIVTKAMPGQSMHNFGLALDFVTCDGYGKNIDWTVGPKWKRAAAIAKELGFIWGGDWKSFYDAPHIEYSNGYTAAQIKAGKWPTFKPFTPINTKKKEELTVDQYTELKNLINAQAKRIEELENIVDEKDAQVSLWAKDGWAWAVKEGLVDGTMPKRPLTREQFAAIEYRKAKK